MVYLQCLLIVFIMVLVVGALIILIPLMGLLNSSVANLVVLVPNSVDIICNKARFMVLFTSVHYFMVLLMNFMHDLIFPLLAW